jgi:hypothetical protein
LLGQFPLGRVELRLDLLPLRDVPHLAAKFRFPPLLMR